MNKTDRAELIRRATAVKDTVVESLPLSRLQRAEILDALFVITDGEVGQQMSDKDLDCPLFRQLQVYLKAEFDCDEDEALEFARSFMRDYWLNQPNYPDEVIS